MIRWRRLCPPVAARIWLCHHEPGEPENLMDMPFLQGQIGLDLTPPLQIWAMVEYEESSPGQRHQLAAPPFSTRIPRSNRAQAYAYAPMPLWQQQRARRITLAEYESELRWHAWAKTNAPTHPDFLWRKLLDRAAMPVPRFGEVA